MSVAEFEGIRAVFGKSETISVFRNIDGHARRYRADDRLAGFFAFYFDGDRLFVFKPDEIRFFPLGNFSLMPRPTAVDRRGGNVMLVNARFFAVNGNHIKRGFFFLFQNGYIHNF